MKKLLTYVSILTLVISCNTINQHTSASAVGLVNLQYFAPKNVTDLPYNYNFMVITSQSEFDNTFGITRSGNINITYPSFNGQTVVACVAQPSTKKLTIHFEKAEVAGKDMNVYCSTSESDEQLKNATTPVAVATIPKALDVKRIVFYTNGEKVTTKAVNYNTQEINATKVNNEDLKPVVLKRTMRRPTVI